VNTHVQSLKVSLKSVLPWPNYNIFLGDCFLFAHPIYIFVSVNRRNNEARAHKRIRNRFR